jgi:hypothetical protein
VYPTDLITNVTLFNPFDSRHQLKEDSLADAEAQKNRAYKADYHVHSSIFAQLAKIPLVSKVLISLSISSSLLIIMCRVSEPEDLFRRCALTCHSCL